MQVQRLNRSGQSNKETGCQDLGLPGIKGLGNYINFLHSSADSWHHESCSAEFVIQVDFWISGGKAALDAEC